MEMMAHSFLDNATLEPSKVKALKNLPYFGYSTVDYFLMSFIVKIIEYGVNKNKDDKLLLVDLD